MGSLGRDRAAEIKSECFTPRSYQVELLDKATKRNIIVQLGTGAGKTFIAVLLIKEYALQLRPPLSSGGRRAFFVVDKVALVSQQAEHIECHTSLSVGRTHGNMNTIVWESKAAFDEFFDKHHVIVLTAQVLLDLIDHGFLRLNNIALLIFDECHHALGQRHPFRIIMDRYRDLNEAERPRVLGLTASLINDKTAPIVLESKLAKLEAILCCTIETSCDLVSVSKYGTKAHVSVISCYNFAWKDIRYGLVSYFLESVRSFCADTREFHPEFDVDIRKPIMEAVHRTQSVLKQLGPWATWKITQFREKELRAMKNQTYLGIKQQDFIALGETAMTTVRRILEPKMKTIHSLEAMSECLPDRFLKLLKILEMYNPENGDDSQPLSAIVFVEQRYVAFVMRLMLKAVGRWEPSRFGFIKVDYVVGYNGSSFENEESQALHKKQEEVLRKFRRGELNVLISTNVLEEGMDVRHCNLVVKFDRPTNFRSYVQSKGRARKEDARFVVLVEEKDTEACTKDLENFDLIEKMLLRRCRTVHNPPESDISNVDQLMPPYIVPSTGAQLHLSGAISLVNRYCGKLPSDVFTRLVPMSRLIPIEDGTRKLYSAELLLPMNSPVKEAITLDDPVESKKLAQMLVAFKTCKLLHARRELNDHLLPVGKEAAVVMQLDEDPDEWTPAISAKVGSAKRKQLYDKKVARALHLALPRVGIPLHLYVLEIDLINPISEEANYRNRKVVNPRDTDFCFGFLSANKIPKIPAFPAFLRQGESRVSLVRAPTTITLNEKTLTYLKHFHHYIFKNVLQLLKEGLDFRLDEQTPMSTLIVPLNKVRQDGKVEYALQMEYVTAVVTNMEDMPRVPSDDHRQHYKFDPEEYKDAVVMPWYRSIEQPTFFYVAEVLTNLTPASPFPDEDYSSFNEYFLSKYDLKIYDQEQNLLEVDYTSNRLNLLLPRLRNRKPPKTTPSSSSQRQILVPELLDVHPISATLFNSISALPSFFYRMNWLLLADELRQKIMEDALGYGTMECCVDDEFEWTPLSYPTTHEEKQNVMVTKLSQLRDPNQETEEIPNENHDDFEIGVWDPELAVGLLCESSPKKVDSWVEETVGLSSTMDGEMSDDDDDHAILFFDMSKYVNESARNEKFAEPRKEIIIESGWGDVANSPAPAVDAPFMIVGPSSNEINLNGLMADLVRQILPTAAAPETRTHNKGYVPGMDLDDKERPSTKDQVVDLITFDDDPEELTELPQEDEEAEMAELDKGEKEKMKRDHVMVTEDLNEAEVLVPIPKKCRFSFHEASNLECVTRVSTTSPVQYGVSPSLLLTALTTNNANDGMNLERLETMGDSFLKYAVTDYLFHEHEDLHEGQLSFARSKEVSNCNLYRLGKKVGIPSLIVGSKFDVHDGWLPPCYVPITNFKAPNADDAEEKDKLMESVLEGTLIESKMRHMTGWDEAEKSELRTIENGVETITFPKHCDSDELSPLPYNMLTQQCISDKSIADAVEALIGAHLLSLGPKPTLKMMKWLGLKVMDGPVESKDPLLRYVDTPAEPDKSSKSLVEMWNRFDFSSLEDRIGYRFRKKAYLIQAFTHASYYPNRITGCYQRLEFLGDAVLDYMITRFLFEHEKQYSPGVLTDLRSALVNNTIFASLAVRYNFHKHFVAMCPGLHFMIEKFVRLCGEKHEKGANFDSEMYMVTTEEEVDEGQEEDVEVPKAMGDIFESVAGAIYLDCGRDLDIVWRVFYHLMRDTIEECCSNPPRSPVRELLELEMDRAKFSKLERIMETGKVRVTVEIGGKMRFTGMGRNYRIAKTTAAKRALRYLRSLEKQKKKQAKP